MLLGSHLYASCSAARSEWPSGSTSRRAISSGRTASSVGWVVVISDVLFLLPLVTNMAARGAGESSLIAGASVCVTMTGGHHSHIGGNRAPQSLLRTTFRSGQSAGQPSLIHCSISLISSGGTGSRYAGICGVTAPAGGSSRSEPNGAWPFSDKTRFELAPSPRVTSLRPPTFISTNRSLVTPRQKGPCETTSASGPLTALSRIATTSS